MTSGPFTNVIESSQIQGFRFVKALGWGGEGMACLFQYRDSQDRPQLIVVKINFKEEVGSSTTREKKSLAVSNFLLLDTRNSTNSNHCPDHS